MLTLTQIKKFAEENKYLASQYYLSRCVDGRYTHTSFLAPLAVPGADLGYLMTVLAANGTYHWGLSFEACKNIILNVVGGESKFHFHTDTHAEDIGTGCGHFRQAILDPHAYRLTSRLMEEIKSFLRDVLKSVVCTMLDGDHKEGAVVLIESEKYSMASQDKKGIQVFVYHKTFDEQRQTQIAETVHQKLSTISCDTIFAQLGKVAQIQRNETLSRLAKGLPVYQLRIDEKGDMQIAVVTSQIA